MTKPRFYLDEHIAHAVAHGLKARGIDVVTAVEADMAPASDEKHLTWAMEHERVLVTFDSDFVQLHEAGWQHFGIVYCPRERSIGEIIRGIVLIHEVLLAEELKNHLEFL